MAETTEDQITIMNAIDALEDVSEQEKQQAIKQLSNMDKLNTVRVLKFVQQNQTEKLKTWVKSFSPGSLFYSILFYSILFYSILFYSILFYSILFYSILFYSIRLLFYSIRLVFLFHSVMLIINLFLSSLLCTLVLWAD